MALNRTKLAAAAVLVAGGLAAGLGPVLFPMAVAQPPGAGSPSRPAPGTVPAAVPLRPIPPSRTVPGGLPGLPGGSSLGSAPGMGEGGFGMEGMPGRPASPYRYAAKPRSAVAFAGLLRNFAEEGWEYVGATEYSSEELLKAARTPNDLINNFEPGSSALLIFKRAPRTAARSAGSGTSSFGPMSSMGGPGLPGAGGGSGGRRGGRRTGGEDPMGGSSDGMGMAMPGADPMASGTSPPAYEVIRLRSGKAEEIARVLGEVFHDRRDNFRVVADPTSNSIVVVASQTDLKIVKSLLEKLEEQR